MWPVRVTRHRLLSLNLWPLPAIVRFRRTLTSILLGIELTFIVDVTPAVPGLKVAITNRKPSDRHQLPVHFIFGGFMNYFLSLCAVFAFSSVAMAAGGSNVGSSNGSSLVIESDNSAAQVNIARVTQLVTLVNKPDIQVNIAVQDLGGSTDVSPTQRLFFNLYAKGEIFSTHAAFDLGAIYKLISAERVSGGKYLVKAEIPDEDSMPKTAVLTINAEDAILKIKELKCDDFDCDASTNFKAKIEVKIQK